MDEKRKLKSDGRSFSTDPLCKRGHVKTPGKDCRECNRIRCAEHWKNKRSEYLSYQAERYHGEKHDEIRAQQKQYRDENWDAVYAKQKEWVAKNRGKVSESFKRYYQANKEKHRARVRDWIERNRDKWRVANNSRKNARRARLKGAFGSHSELEWQAVCRKQKQRCAICGEKRKLTRDHIIPLSRGGSDMIVNIQALCQPCNSAKAAIIREDTHYSLFDEVN